LNHLPVEPPRVARPLRITPAGALGTLALLLVVALCVRLGFWQLARHEERREMNAAVAERLVAPAVRDVAMLADTVGLSYRAATVNGIYDNERSIVLPGRSHRGVPGVHLLSPLLVDGRSDAILINRGWVPSPDASTIDVADFAVAETVSVHGLLLPFPGAAQSLAQRPGGDVSEVGFRRVWYTVDATRLAAQYPYPLLPVLVQELPDEGTASRDRPRYPIRLEAPPLDEGPHLGYALQWFSFGLIGIIGWLALVLRGRMAPRAVAPRTGVTAALLLTAAAPLLTSAPVHGQLRPVEPLDWRIFDADVAIVGGVGFGLLAQQPAPLAGTRGTLHEAGLYHLAIRSGRMAVAVGGTAVWRLSGEVQESMPVALVRGANGSPRQDAGPAYASTLVRLSPDAWPADVVLRFGATIPTTSDESGLDRDRTDFFALLGARYRYRTLSVYTEHGVGINGTVIAEYPQSDVWTYNFGASLQQQHTRLVMNLVGRQDGRTSRVRGNEDLRELRAGVDIGSDLSLQLRYVHGLTDFSPTHGIRISAGFIAGR
jgi:surfeit locus 1 family protein